MNSTWAPGFFHVEGFGYDSYVEIVCIICEKRIADDECRGFNLFDILKKTSDHWSEIHDE